MPGKAYGICIVMKEGRVTVSCWGREPVRQLNVCYLRYVTVEGARSPRGVKKLVLLVTKLLGRGINNFPGPVGSILMLEGDSVSLTDNTVRYTGSVTVTCGSGGNWSKVDEGSCTE